MGRAAAVFLVVALFASSSRAHTVGLSRGLYTVLDDEIALELVLARAEAKALVPALDGNTDQVNSSAQLAPARSTIEQEIARRIVVTRGASSCRTNVVHAGLTEEDGLAIRLTFACQGRGETTVQFLLVDALAAGHRHLAHIVTPAGESDAVARAGASSFVLSPAARPSRVAYAAIGFEHIVAGLDHLVFLFGLVLVGGRLRSLLGVITAFTLAHSLTLGLVVLGIWVPSSSVIEPLIALSIAYVGVENLFIKSAAGRFRISAPFGLVHGFGFGGGLIEVGVPRDDVPMTLLLFNVGVELGQLMVLVALVPALTFLTRRGLFDTRAKRALSCLIVVLGVVWFVQRVVAT